MEETANTVRKVLQLSFYDDNGDATTVVDGNVSRFCEQSSFFYTLFTIKGFKESSSPSIHLHMKDKLCFLRLSDFMKTNQLAEDITTKEILDVLRMADQFLVTNCQDECIERLLLKTLSIETAKMCFDWPFMRFNELREHAGTCLARKFSKLLRFPDKLHDIPLLGIQSMLRSETLEPDSEDQVLDFAQIWVARQNSSMDERKKLMDQLLPHVFLPHLSPTYLENLALGMEASYALIQSMSYKLGREQLPQGRSYRFHPIRFFQFTSPMKHTMVFIEIDRMKLGQMYPHGHITMQPFPLGEMMFSLQAYRHYNEHGDPCLGLNLRMISLANLTARAEFSVRMNPSRGYSVLGTTVSRFASDIVTWCPDIFKTTWNEFITENSLFFISGVLHLRIEMSYNS